MGFAVVCFLCFFFFIREVCWGLRFLLTSAEEHSTYLIALGQNTEFQSNFSRTQFEP